MTLALAQNTRLLERSLLHDYQSKAVDFIKQNPFCALWLSMGMGKSVSTLTAIVDLADMFEVNRVLIIAPLRVANYTWPDEIHKWEHIHGLDYAVATGTPLKRKIALTLGHTVTTINRENIPWLVKYYGNKWPFDMVVIDESSSFKSSKSKRFKALRKVLPYIDRLVGLTGTPASNGLLDTWSQIFLIDKGKRLGRTFSGFQQRYFTSDYMGYNWTPLPGTEEKIYERLSDICLTLSAEDYLKLPDRVDNFIGVDIPNKARNQYKQLEKDFLLELENDEVVVQHAAALTNKLLQFSNGAVYTDDQGNWEAVHTAKLDALEEIINEAAGQPVLVAYNFKSDKARILERFKQAVSIDSPDAMDDWNKGEIPILIAHPASAGHGLNLQDGGNIIAWYGLNWSLELYQQFNARLHRQGQTMPVIIHHIMLNDSVDQSVMDALGGKHKTQRDLLDALKRDIEVRTR